MKVHSGKFRNLTIREHRANMISRMMSTLRLRIQTRVVWEKENYINESEP